MRLAAALTGLWAVVTIGGLWQFVYRYALPAAPPSSVSRVSPGEFLTSDSGERIPLTGSILLLDFTSEDCGCSQFLKSSIDRLASTYGKQGVRFVHVIESSDAGAPRGIRVLDPHGVVARRFQVGATPGAVIVDAGGQIAYAGAYNRARFCDDADSAFAEHALDAVLAGRKPNTV